jgi:hypothetical protein
MSDKERIAFNEDVALGVCGYLAQGFSLRRVERQPGMPSKAAVLKWLLEGAAYKANGEPEHPKALFVDQYARAREVQADCLADEIIEISDESSYDLTTDEEGREIVNMNHIQRDRLRVDSRKWYAGKLRPKVYGDKLETKNEHSGPGGGPMQVSGTLTVELIEPTKASDA